MLRLRLRVMDVGFRVYGFKKKFEGLTCTVQCFDACDVMLQLLHEHLEKIYLDDLQLSLFSIMEKGLYDKRRRAHMRDPTLDESLQCPNLEPEGMSC